MGRLDRLELVNFKSYGGTVVVGPFKGFTAVIGTNGSGKSNLMDAISFVLGVKTSQLRGNQLRDLVYRNLDDPNDNPSRRRASVKLVYQSSDENDRASEIEFMRTVNLNGASEYRVKGQPMSLEKYNQHLARIGVLVKARNFLVFQNEVEGIASKSPKDLAVMFEEVSESADFRHQYEEARAEHDSASTEVTHFWKKRKDVAAEKRQYREQQQEAEKYKRLQRQVENTKTERAIFELFHVDEDLRTVKTELTSITDELEVQQRQLSKKESVFNTEKRKLQELEKERGKLERMRKRVREEVERLRPTEVKYETELSVLTRRIKGDTKTLEKLKLEASKGAEVVAEMEGKLSDCREQIKALENEIREAEEASVSAESMAEYRSLKDEVATKTSALQQELEVAKRNAENAEREKKTLQSRERDLQERVSQSSNDANVNKRRAEELASQLQQTRREIENTRQDLSRRAEVMSQRNRVRDELEKTIRNATQSLRDAKADMNESGQERAMNNAFEQMKSLFPGVHGRLTDLCQPTQARYREAVAVSLGKMMNAIVVEDQKVGSDCIRFLKDQRVGTATFIPLNDIRPRPVDESLRHLGGSARLVVDVLRHSEAYERAVLYAAGNAVVCDTLDEARRLRYEGGRKLKICSLDGTLINRAGFMTGGTSRSDSSAARKWDRAEIDTLKRKRAAAQQELNALGDADTDRRETAALNEKLDELTRRMNILNDDRKEILARSTSSAKESEQCALEVENLLSQVQNAVTQFEAAKKKVDRIEKRLHGLENELFGDFTQRHNIQTVQEFEELFVKKSETMRAKKAQLETKEVELKTTLRYEKAKNKVVGISRLEKKIVTQKAKKDSTEDDLNNLATKRTEYESRLESISKSVEEIIGQKQKTADLIADKRQDFKKEAETVAEIKKEHVQKRSKFEQLQSQRKKLLIAAKVAQVHIPTRDVSSDDEDDVDDDGDIVMGSEDQNDGDESTPAGIEVNVNISIDYSSLSRRHRAAATVVKQREMLDSFSEKVRTIEQQLDGLAPNMKANEHISDVNEKLEALEHEAEEARKRQGKALSNFENIKAKRQDRFSACFNHVANKINEVYQQLTRSTAYPMGGNAYLSLERQDEPYLGGIKFNAMPPTKRFRDMEQLSGGERTVAALALLFAIHDFRPSPFFVLDEVDAALDKLNVGRVSSYIRSRAPGLQTIVISLKDSFYERADALVGIYRDVSLHSSRLLTLDLSQYDDIAMSQPAQSSQPSQPIAT